MTNSSVICSWSGNLIIGLLPERQHKQLMKQYDDEQELETKMETMKQVLLKKSKSLILSISFSIRKCNNLQTSDNVEEPER